MAFNYNGINPTEINYNGTSVNVVSYNGTNIWGKPYLLTISQGNNTAVTVTRISSPNQQAQTGTLTNGSTIYYGDVIQINASANSGYNLSSLKVNNSDWSNGNTLTITSGVYIETTAVVNATWHTVWTGNKKESWSNLENTEQALATPIRLIGNIPTRISGIIDMDYGEVGETDSSVTFSLTELPCTISSPYWFASVTFHYVYADGSCIVCTRNPDKNLGPDHYVGPGAVTFTRIDQYY